MIVAPGFERLRTPVLDRLMCEEECVLKCEAAVTSMRVGVKGLPSGCILMNAMNDIEFYINTGRGRLVPACLLICFQVSSPAVLLPVFMPRGYTVRNAVKIWYLLAT